MSWKGVLATAAILLLLLAGYTMLTMEKEAEPEPEPLPFSFRMHILDSGLVDSDYAEQARAYVTVHTSATSVDSISMRMLLLSKPPKSNIYEITDYPSGKEKRDVMDTVRNHLSSYGVYVNKVRLDEALSKQDSIIILPTDAIPDVLVSEEMNRLLDGNVVVFFGKPLDISIDQTASQTLHGTKLYDILNVTYQRTGFSAKFGGPEIYEYGNATIFEYEKGWFVIYNDLRNDGLNIANIILGQSWQQNRVESVFNPPLGNNSITYFSGPFDEPEMSMRLIYDAESANDSSIGLVDIVSLKKPSGTLKISQLSSTAKDMDYSFELHDELDYPAMYDMKLQFNKDGDIVETVKAKPVIMKTVAIDSGTVRPNISSGDYLVRLVDQTGTVHAAAYTQVPLVRIRLFQISGIDHLFNITENGQPVRNTPITLIINGNERIHLQTDYSGVATASLRLQPGLHSFTVELKDQTGTTYYEKKEGGFGIMHAAFVLGVLFLIGGFFLKSKGQKKYFIKTYQRPSGVSKTIRIPHSIFLDIFRMSQEGRARGLPLSVSDLRIGMRRYAVYKGAPVFLTDSNIFRLLDSMVKSNRFLSFGGYYLPESMAKGKPIEYWVLKRMLVDHFIEKGEELSKAKNAEFKVRGKLVHIWHDLNPKLLVKLCKKADNVIVFPDEVRKGEFMAKASKCDPDWMKVSLEFQYGRIFCQTIDEFLGRSNGKG